MRCLRGDERRNLTEQLMVDGVAMVLEAACQLFSEKVADGDVSAGRV